MSELSDALHNLADAVGRGEVLAGAQSCSIVMHDSLDKISVTYIGRNIPANLAGMNLLSMGIQHGINRLAAEGGGQMGLTRGSTH